jgi:multisubunit Na+/H+ antiporter MnhB subunit
MKMLLLVGLIVLGLGIASLIVPVPHTETHGFKAGDVKIAVQTHDSERVSPIVSAVLIGGGIALTIAGARGGVSKN